jgi:hypothetical protein
MAPRYSWHGTHGHRTITTIVKKLILQWENDLHSAQYDLVARILDGQDIFCFMTTVGRKSALFSVPILILREMARNSDLYPNLRSRKELLLRRRRALLLILYDFLLPVDLIPSSSRSWN